jgi:DNA-binding transcriptional LysR family regulator
MTLDQLNVLATVVETGSFSEAAKKLHRVQSAVSIAVKKLEDSLSLEIFDRTGYRPQLTDAGREIHRQALNILKQSEFLSYTAGQLSVGEESEIAIAIDGICPLELFTPVLKVFNEEHPHVRIQLYVEYLGSIERLAQGNIDLAITQVLEWPSWIEAIPWIEIPYIPVVSSDHPLAELGNQVHRHLDEFTHIVVTSSQYAQLSVNIEQEENIWQVGDFSSKRQLIIEGLGWGYMPQHLIKSDLENNKLVILNLNNNKPSAIKLSGKSQFLVDTHKVYLTRRNDRPIGPLTNRFWNLFKESNIK